MTVYSPSGYNVDDFIQNPYHASSKRAQEQQEALERGIQLGMKLGIQMAQGQGK